MEEINEVIIEVTMKCNKSCEFCFNKIIGKEISHELNTNQIKLLIDKIYDANVRTVRFTGGEPLLRNDIFELMEYAYSKGLKVWLNTNGSLITKENAEKINEYVENILLPFNSLDDESSLEDAVNKLRGSKKIIRCGTVATPENIENLEKFLEIVERLNIDDWEIFRPIPLKADSNLMNHEHVKILVEKLLLFKNKTGKTYFISNALPFCSYEPKKVENVSRGAATDDGYVRFVIGVDGSARPSYFIIEKIGDLLKDSVTNCWNNDFMIKMRGFYFIPKVCKGCKYVEKCRGGSRFVSKLVNGSYESLDPLSNIQYIKNLSRSNRWEVGKN